MKTKQVRFLIVVSSAVALFGMASCTNNKVVEDVVGDKPCLACHHLTETRTGPAFVDISRRYSQTKNRYERLTTVILEGGVSNWGIIPMPPVTSVSKQEADELARWIVDKSQNARHRNQNE